MLTSLSKLVTSVWVYAQHVAGDSHCYGVSCALSCFVNGLPDLFAFVAFTYSTTHQGFGRLWVIPSSYRAQLSLNKLVRGQFQYNFNIYSHLWLATTDGPGFYGTRFVVPCQNLTNTPVRNQKLSWYITGPYTHVCKLNYPSACVVRQWSTIDEYTTQLIDTSLPWMKQYIIVGMSIWFQKHPENNCIITRILRRFLENRFLIRVMNHWLSLC